MLYVLIDRESGEVVYVGRTTNLKQRAIEQREKFPGTVMFTFNTNMTEFELIFYLKDIFDLKNKRNGDYFRQIDLPIPPDGIVRADYMYKSQRAKELGIQVPEKGKRRKKGER